MTSKSPKNIFALAFLALLVYLNFENDPHASPDEAMFAMEMNDGSGGLRGNGNSQAPLFELTGRRSLSQEEINEVAKFTGWVEEKSAEFDKEQRHRFLAILKTRWPECITDGLNAHECKKLIDRQIKRSGWVTKPHKNGWGLTTQILQTRTKFDENYNVVVIRTDASLNGHTVGVKKDGMINYDFVWDSSGTEAIDDQKRKVPPVKLDGGLYQLVNGSTIDEYRGTEGAIGRKLWGESGHKESVRKLEVAYDPNAIIAGGQYNSNYTDDTLAKQQLDDYLATQPMVRPAGEEIVGPWDCSGLTGVSCCAKIKHDVRESDTRGNAIQCWIEEDANPDSPLTTSKVCEHDVKKICIYAIKYGHGIHDSVVTQAPILAYSEVLANYPNIVDSGVSEGA